jgi:hypothetical protein
VHDFRPFELEKVDLVFHLAERERKQLAADKLLDAFFLTRGEQQDKKTCRGTKRNRSFAEVNGHWRLIVAAFP